MDRTYRDGRVRVRDATSFDCLYVGCRLRARDLEEIEALLGAVDPVEALMESRASSRTCLTVLFDDLPVLMFGVADHPLDPTVGIPWMLGTNRIEDLWFTFLRHGKALADEVFGAYRALCNVTHIKNAVAHRWLRSLDFEFTEIGEDQGCNGEALIYFQKEQEPCVNPSP